MLYIAWVKFVGSLLSSERFLPGVLWVSPLHKNHWIWFHFLWFGGLSIYYNHWDSNEVMTMVIVFIILITLERHIVRQCCSLANICNFDLTIANSKGVFMEGINEFEVYFFSSFLFVLHCSCGTFPCGISPWGSKTRRGLGWLSGVSKATGCCHQSLHRGRVSSM